MKQGGHRVSRAEFEINIHLKLQDKGYTSDISPLLATGRTWDLEKAIKLVSKNLIEAIPGDPWKGEGGAAVSFPPSALPSLNADAAQTGIKVVEKCK